MLCGVQVYTPNKISSDDNVVISKTLTQQSFLMVADLGNYQTPLDAALTVGVISDVLYLFCMLSHSH